MRPGTPASIPGTTDRAPWARGWSATSFCVGHSPSAQFAQPMQTGRKPRQRSLRRASLFANAPVDQLAYDIKVPDVACILLQQVGEDPAERWRIA